MTNKVNCISLQVLDDDFNKITKDRQQHINAFIHFPFQKLKDLESEENVSFLLCSLKGKTLIN